jgi:hypothetical protein
MDDMQYDVIDEECIEVYRGKYYTGTKSRSVKKVIVFDLDETLGSFTDMDILWHTIDSILKNDNILDFAGLFELYPEFLRVGILKILDYVYRKKKSGDCYKLYIYTNNQSQSYYVNMICDYLTNTICKKNDILFDQIIYAFKINERIIQIGRTSHSKIHSDLINCTLLPKKTAVCFLDDLNFDDMKKERIYYIQPKAYRHNLSTDTILQRLFKSKYMCLLNDYKHLIRDEFISRINIQHSFNSGSKTKLYTLQQNEQITKKMMYHIREFFLLSKKKQNTKKKGRPTSRFTRKIKLANS